MSLTLMRELDKARIVRFDEGRELLYAWFGGHGVHAYNVEGDEVDFWNVGDWSKNNASAEDVIESMEERIHGVQIEDEDDE